MKCPDCQKEMEECVVPKSVMTQLCTVCCGHFTDEGVRVRIAKDRRTFGKLAKTKGAVRRKIGLAIAQGWGEIEIEEVTLGGRKFWKLTGYPFARKIVELAGIVPNVNQPRIISDNRRNGQAFRHGGN